MAVPPQMETQDMGIKEESLKPRTIPGYAAQLRPQQTVGGLCVSCQLSVWIDLPEPMAASETFYVHYSCQNYDALRSRYGHQTPVNFIPVPTFRK